MYRMLQSVERQPLECSNVTSDEQSNMQSPSSSNQTNAMKEIYVRISIRHEEKNKRTFD